VEEEENSGSRVQRGEVLRLRRGEGGGRGEGGKQGRTKQGEREEGRRKVQAKGADERVNQCDVLCQIVSVGEDGCIFVWNVYT